VLLVEDNPTDVFVVREVLKRSGLNVRLRVASNGQEALSYLQEPCAADDRGSCPSLVLLDLNLPKVPGIEVLKNLRAGSRCECIPVIILTSSAAEADRNAAQRLGAEAYFQKPDDLNEYDALARIVKHVLDRTRTATG
jgi:CheY-like chemotaxis protein